ncbi:MAG: BMP family ABC transporter substrate-binding protein [Anaerolineales bacterium]
MTKKVLSGGVILLAMALVLSSCRAGLFKPKVALLLARGGLGDKAFNDSANAGLQRAAGELGAETKNFDFQGNDNDQITLLRQIAQQGYDPIIAVGSENVVAVNTVATEYPKLNFVVIDASGKGKNITSVIFNELEGDFLVGALAALLSPHGKIGYLGGAEVTVIHRIEFGFKQGVKYVNPKAKVDAHYIGGQNDFSGFARPDVGKRLTIRLYYEDGDEIVYAAAGGSDLGAIDAAKEAGKPIITTGSDQRWIAPDVVVTSRTKNMDDAVFLVIQQFIQGSLQPGTITLDYKSGGIGLMPISGKLASAETLAKFEKIRSDLEAGKIFIQPYTGG